MAIDVAPGTRFVAGYAARLHAAIGPAHHVASPLGAWLLLALAAPRARGETRAALADILGCDADHAARLASELLADPHPAVHAAVASWSQPGRVDPAWLAGLPEQVATGPVPSQAELDEWARRNTLGLIEKFPVTVTPDTYLVLASALATRVSWQSPFSLAPASALGAGSAWTGRIGQVLRSPRAPGHQVLIAAAGAAGDVGLHAARSRDGLLVVSVIAEQDVPSADVLGKAHEFATELATTSRIAGARSLFDLPLGETPLWAIEEIAATGPAEACQAVLPAWSARSDHDLSLPGLGFGDAAAAVGAGGPWEARQSAVARYSRTGFEAAAVTTMMMLTSLRPQITCRRAQVRFGHPYAVVAVAAAPDQPPGRDEAEATAAAGRWSGMPVFSAWITEPAEAAEDD